MAPYAACNQPKQVWGLVGAAMAIACAALCGSAQVARAAESDATATHAYLLAQYRLVATLLHKGEAGKGANGAAGAQVARECPGVVSAMPSESSQTGGSNPSPRERGERARLTQQRLTIAQELDAIVVQPQKTLYRPIEQAYASEVSRLSWSNPEIASAIAAAITPGPELLTMPVAPFCADAKAWAQSGFRALSNTSREFEASLAARQRATQAEGHVLDALLKPYENASDRALIRRTEAVEFGLFATALANGRTIFRLEQIVGFPYTAPEEPKQVTLGHGRTAAGTRFQVSSQSLGLLGVSSSCHRAAAVSYSRPGVPELLMMGGPNNPICVSQPHFRRPAVFCEAGIETIQTAVPPSVRLGRLVLADGREIGSRVIHISRPHGGPMGIYAQELLGGTSHARTIVELNATGAVVLTLKLPRYRCVKHPGETEGLPTRTALTNATTPNGETFTISAFGALNSGVSSLGVDIGVDPEVGEMTIGAQAPKPYAWRLSIGCAPHPYAILYGILAPPGRSVVAQTPEGAVTLEAVPTETPTHAKGPLVYGVFGALPSELTVLGPSGTPVYTENLEAKASEAEQFCEGYVEP